MWKQSWCDNNIAKKKKKEKRRKEGKGKKERKKERKKEESDGGRRLNWIGSKWHPLVNVDTSARLVGLEWGGGGMLARRVWDKRRRRTERIGEE